MKKTTSCHSNQECKIIPVYQSTVYWWIKPVTLSDHASQTSNYTDL